ncbi:hypothetical protein GZD43_004358 [Vibrio alginolyticus]|nr:hypothetical protein [Vibrio alginolyticus]EGR0804963.1 hypothetical protein [Vibrio alginolyticus]
MENAESYPIPLIAHNFLQEHNAALRGEQRIPPKLNHCAVNTKANDRMRNAKRWESLLNALLLR